MSANRDRGWIAAAAGLCVLMAGPSYAADRATPPLKVGDRAPHFTAPADDGTTFDSRDYLGKKILVVYFYPADLTGGCTKEACGFRDDLSKLAAADVEVVGVSGDTVKNHRVFKETHKLNFKLLADPRGTVAKRFGVPVAKGGEVTLPGPGGTPVTLERGVTESRWTFVIGKDGTIRYVNTKVNAAQQSKEILAELEHLKKAG